jgi:hypothetical protein
MATNARPIACTLSAKQLRDRRAWIADLAHDGLLSHQRGDLALCLRYRPDVVGRVRRMVELEEACCAFLSFHLHEQPDAVTLTIKAPEEAREIADGMFDQFVATAR